MVRGITILWAILALLAGVGLFLLKHDVQTKEDQLARLNRKISADRSAIHVLQAEWTYLNSPDRLRELAARYLPEMQPMKSDQVTTMDALPQRQPDGSPAPSTAKPVASKTSPRSGAALPPAELVSVRPPR